MADLVRHIASRFPYRSESGPQDGNKAQPDSSWNTRKFQHQPLDETRQQIRLLRILPKGSDAETDIIACEIRSFDFPQAARFSALSYAWGEHSRKGNIRMNDVTLIVRLALLDALRHLRRYFAPPTSCAATPDWILIDALCINQTDTEEKASQVRLMADLYDRAKKVISWLGSGDPTITSAFSFIAETVHAARSPTGSGAQVEMLIRREPVVKASRAARETRSIQWTPSWIPV